MTASGTSANSSSASQSSPLTPGAPEATPRKRDAARPARRRARAGQQRRMPASRPRPRAARARTAPARCRLRPAPAARSRRRARAAPAPGRPSSSTPAASVIQPRRVGERAPRGGRGSSIVSAVLIARSPLRRTGRPSGGRSASWSAAGPCAAPATRAPGRCRLLRRARRVRSLLQEDGIAGPVRVGAGVDVVGIVAHDQLAAGGREVEPQRRAGALGVRARPSATRTRQSPKMIASGVLGLACPSSAEPARRASGTFARSHLDVHAAVVRQRDQRPPHAGVDPQRDRARRGQRGVPQIHLERPEPAAQRLRAAGRRARAARARPRSCSARSARRRPRARPTAARAPRSAAAPTRARAAPSPPASRPAPRAASATTIQPKPKTVATAPSAAERAEPEQRAARLGQQDDPALPRRGAVLALGGQDQPGRRVDEDAEAREQRREHERAAQPRRPARPSAPPGRRRRRRASVRGGRAKSEREARPWRPLSGARAASPVVIPRRPSPGFPGQSEIVLKVLSRRRRRYRGRLGRHRTACPTTPLVAGRGHMRGGLTLPSITPVDGPVAPRRGR